MKKDEWDVYIIRTESGKLYTGICKDLERRFSEHQSGQKGARFFHFSAPKAVVYQEKHSNRSSASKREAEIKKMKRSQKLELISKI
ncbi:MAG: hypothetical protein CMO81_09690 [Waddliaceae bacterium]|nr:hypothetical protein [Waddliaceae bacterium]